MVPDMDRRFLLDVLKQLIETPSLPGMCGAALRVVERIVNAMGLSMTVDRRGNGCVVLPGRTSGPAVLAAAHLDTVGLLVRGICSDGSLRVAPLGGPNPRSIENERVFIHTSGGDAVPGVLYHDQHSMHFPKAADPQCPQGVEHLHVLLDRQGENPGEVQALGISVGDMISLAPHFRLLENGFISSRFLDNKASVACVLAMLKSLRDTALLPEHRVILLFTNGEEVGQSCHVPQDVGTYLALDVGLIHPTLATTMRDVAIIRADSRGPYDKAVFDRLTALARRENILFQAEVYCSGTISYGTDAVTARASGADVLCGAFGPGTYGAHGLERTHLNALEGTARLLLAYLLGDDGGRKNLAGSGR